MDRVAYHNIRKTNELSRFQWALPLYLIQNFLLLGLIGLIWSASEGGWTQYFSIPFMAIFLFRNFSMMHEAVHGVASRRKAVNEFVGVISGAICFLPFEPWKRSHLQHHYWSGNVERDPVTAFIIAYPKMSKRTHAFFDFFWRRWFPMLGVVQHVVFWILSAKQYLAEPRSWRIFISIFANYLFWGALFSVSSTAFSGAVLMSILVYLVGVEVVNLPHHLQLPQYRGDTKLPIWEQHQVARSCVYPEWFARLVVLNFNYHIEHHMYPDVPWYHLRKLHFAVKENLAEKYNTDPQFKWILENKRNSISKVLDPAPLTKQSEAA